MDSCFCKACGEGQLQSKERRPLQGQPYSTLLDIVTTETQAPPTVVNKILASGGSYICKKCYSVLTKYVSIRENRKQMKAHALFLVNHQPGVSYDIT